MSESRAKADGDERQRKEMLAYFQRVEATLTDPDFGEDADDRDLFVANVLEEIKGNEVCIATPRIVTLLAAFFHCSKPAGTYHEYSHHLNSTGSNGV